MRIFKRSPLTPEMEKAVEELKQASAAFKSDAGANIQRVEEAIGQLKGATTPHIQRRLKPIEKAVQEFKEVPGDLAKTSEKVQKSLDKLFKWFG